MVYRAEVEAPGDQAGPIEDAAEENDAYSALGQRNTTYLKERGIGTADLSAGRRALRGLVNQRRNRSSCLPTPFVLVALMSL